VITETFGGGGAGFGGAGEQADIEARASVIKVTIDCDRLSDLDHTASMTWDRSLLFL
jgi:hypothetical protein